MTTTYTERTRPSSVSYSARSRPSAVNYTGRVKQIKFVDYLFWIWTDGSTVEVADAEWMSMFWDTWYEQVSYTDRMERERI